MSSTDLLKAIAYKKNACTLRVPNLTPEYLTPWVKLGALDTESGSVALYK